MLEQNSEQSLYNEFYNNFVLKNPVRKPLDQQLKNALENNQFNFDKFAQINSYHYPNSKIPAIESPRVMQMMMCRYPECLNVVIQHLDKNAKQKLTKEYLEGLFNINDFALNKDSIKIIVNYAQTNNISIDYEKLNINARSNILKYYLEDMAEYNKGKSAEKPMQLVKVEGVLRDNSFFIYNNSYIIKEEGFERKFLDNKPFLEALVTAMNTENLDVQKYLNVKISPSGKYLIKALLDNNCKESIEFLLNHGIKINEDLQKDIFKELLDGPLSFKSLNLQHNNLLLNSKFGISEEVIKTYININYSVLGSGLSDIQKNEVLNHFAKVLELYPNLANEEVYINRKKVLFGDDLRARQNPEAAKEASVQNVSGASNAENLPAYSQPAFKSDEPVVKPDQTTQQTVTKPKTEQAKAESAAEKSKLKTFAKKGLPIVGAILGAVAIGLSAAFLAGPGLIAALVVFSIATVAATAIAVNNNIPKKHRLDARKLLRGNAKSHKPIPQNDVSQDHVKAQAARRSQSQGQGLNGNG